MTARAALLGTTGAIAAAMAWTGIASTAFLYGTGLEDRFPYPSWQWWQYLPYARQNATVGLWLAASAALATAFIGACAMRVGWDRLRGARPLHGETHWATEVEAQKAGLTYHREPPGNAFVLGLARGPWGIGRRFVCLGGEEHVSLYARTRSGKGVSVVVPNALNWGGSLVAFSIKRDLVKDAAAERVRKGQKVFVFDPTNPDGKSHRWNPLGNVPRGTGCYDAVQRVMQHIIPETKASNPFWDNAARRIATAVAVLIAETPDAILNISAVKRLLARSDHDKILREMISNARVQGRPYPAAAVDVVLGWLARAGEEGASGVRDNALTAMALWDSEVIAAATETSDFDLAALRHEPMTVFVCAEVADIRRLRPLFSLFFQQLIDFNTRREFTEDPCNRHRLAVLLDELWSLGELKIVADASAFTASFGFRMLYVVQSKQQLHSIYGREGAENLFLNTGAELLFGGADQRLAEEVSKRAGYDTVQDVSTSKPRFMGWLFPSKQSENEAARARALLLPQEVQRLPKDEMLVLRPSLPPLRLSRIKWFSDPWFKRMAGPAPAVPALTITVERDKTL